MAGEDGSVVLPLSIDLSGVANDLESAADLFGAKLSAAISSAMDRATADVPTAGRRGGAATPARDIAAPATGKGGTTTGGTAKVKADVSFNASDVSSELQAAIDGHKFRLNLDQNFLINQIQNALNHAYQITVGGMNLPQAAGGSTTVAATGAVHDTTSAMSRETLDVPKELRQALHQVRDKNKASVLAGAIDDLYGTLKESFEAVGKSVPKATDSISKAFAIFDTIGDDMFEVARAYDPKKPMEVVRLMNQKFGIESGHALNLGPALAGAVKAGGRTGFWGGADNPADRHDWSIRQLRQAGMGQTAPAPAPVRAPAPVPSAVPVAPAPSSTAIEAEQLALRVALTRSSEIDVRSSKIGDTADLMRWFGRSSPAPARSRTRRGQAQVIRDTGPLALAQGPGLPRGVSGEDPEADLAALEQIGERPENVRRLINWGKLQGQAGGLPIDLRGLAISAMKPLGMEGSLQGVFKGRSTGDFYNVAPDIGDFEESSKKIRDARRRQNARLPGIDEAVRGVSPTAAAEEIVRAQYGEPGVEFFNQPGVRTEFRKAVAHAGRLAPLGVRPEKGFQHVGGGGPGSILAGLRDEEAALAAGAGIDPETRAENARLSSLENQERIAAGAGLSEQERLKKRVADFIPKAAGIRIASGNLPDFPKLLENILAEVERGTEPGRLSASSQAHLQDRGGGARMYASLRGQELMELLTRGAQESVTDEDIARIIGAQPGTLTEEQAAQYRPGLGPDDARELRGMMSGVLSDVVGSINPAGYARIVADKNNSASLGTTKTTPFAEFDVNQADARTGRSFTAPRRQRTDAEKEMAKIIAAEKKEKSTLVEEELGDTRGLNLADRQEIAARVRERRERGAEVTSAPPEVNPRKRELQGVLEGAARLRLPASRRVTENMMWAPTPEQTAEFEEQERLQAIASSKRRTSGKDKTGDDLRRVAAKAGQRIAGPLPPDPLNPYFDARVVDQIMRDAGSGEAAAAAGGGGARPPRGRVVAGAGGTGGGGGAGGGGGRGGFGEVSGAVHVIIDGQPVAVTWAGASPGTATGRTHSGDLESAMHGASWDWKMGRASFRRQTTDAAQKTFGSEVDRLRTAGRTDEQIKKAAKAAGLGVAAEAFFDDTSNAAGGIGGAGGRGNLNARLRRLGLDPIKFRTPETLEAVDESDTNRAGLSAEVQKARRFEPRRGFTASVTDIFTNMFPFIEKQSAAINRFAREGTQLASLQAKTPILEENRAGAAKARDVIAERLVAMTAEREGLRTSGGTPSQIGKLTRAMRPFEQALAKTDEELAKATEAVEQHGDAVKDQAERVTTARKGLPGAGGKIAAFGAGAIAAGGAIAVGSMIAQAVGVISDGISKAVGPAFDKALGSPMATADITNAIAKAGAAGTFAASAARTAAEAGQGPGGMDLIAQRAAGIAGNRNMAAQSELLRVQANLGRSGRGLPAGVDESVRTSTGGIFGSPFGITGIGDFQLSAQAQVAKDLAGLPNLGPSPGPTGPIPLNIETGTAALKGGLGMLFGGTGAGKALGLSNDPATAFAPLIGEFTAGLESGSSALDNFNKQAEEGGSKMKLVQDLSEQGMKDAAEFAKSLRAVGLGDLAAVVEQKGLTVQGGPSTGVSGAQLLAAAQRGAAGFDVESLLAASEPQRRAREGLRIQQLQFGLGTQLPAQFGMGYAANPLPTGEQITDFGAAQGLDLSSTAKQYNDIAVSAAAAVQATKDFVATELPEFGAEFAGALDEAAGIGRQISSIKIGLETKQAALAADQYSLSIFQAQRSLKDAKYLTGELTKENKNNVGYLQKQEFLLNRQSQQLSFQMTQRQINFQTALAGFQAPGITGQERAARMAEAKLEAEYAQKQLNIQKELFNLGGDQFMAQAARQVTDLQKQIGLMVRGRELALDTSKATKDIDALNTRLGIVKGQADLIYQAAVAKREAMHQDMAELVAATGKDLNKVASDVVQAYIKVYRGLRNAISNSLMQDSSWDTGQSNSNYGKQVTPGGYPHQLNATERQQELSTGKDLNRNGRLGYAEGIVGSTRGETNITVGEADGEMVAVVKGPKTMSVMGGMNGGGVNIGPFIIQGGDMDQEKAERLAREITDLVEARLGMKARLVGLRSTTA